MLSLLLAKLVVGLHVGFIVFLFFGSLAFRLGRPIPWLHAACLGYGVLITAIGWACPLTLVEQWLIRAGGETPYSGEFLPHYFWSHFGLTGAEPVVAASLIVSLLAVNVMPYRRLLAEQRAAPDDS